MLLERTVIMADVESAKRGMWCGLAVAVIAMVISLGMVVSGHEFAGATIGGGTILSLAGTFVYGTERRKQERIEKAKIMSGQQEPP